jgi:hypothetical protein
MNVQIAEFLSKSLFLSFAISLLFAFPNAKSMKFDLRKLYPLNSLQPEERDNRAMDLTDTDRIAIRAVIEQQIQAFQNDDAVTAFSFASPEIQNQFGSAEHFMDMVKSSYMAVYRPRSVMFEGITTIEGSLSQRVILLGPDGGLVSAYYLMQQQPDQSWRINGCMLMPLEGQSI